MARVVQRRTSPPPYLLVAFVILFLLAMATAVLFWVQTDNLKERLAELEGTYRRVVSPQELTNPSQAIRDMLTEYDRGPQRLTVLTQMSEQIGDLTAIVTGQRTTYAIARTQAEGLAQATGSAIGRGLVTEARELNQDLAETRSELQAMNDKNSELQDLIGQKDKTIDELTASFTAEIQQLKDDKLALDEKLRQAHESYVEEQRRFKAELEQTRTELNMEIANKNQQLRDSVVNLDAKDQTIERLRGELDKKRGAGGADVAARKSDGQVLQAKSMEGVCYVNLGSANRVTPGLTFTVYPSGGIPESGEGKAKIVVTQVKDTISECRIVEQSVDNPIVAGDLIGNVAYDPQRTYTFVVEGRFDLRGKGHYSAEDAKEVKLLVQRYGGQVADQVDVQTDFVVLGAEPERPLIPSENAPETTWAVYQAQMRDFSRYQETVEAAQSMHVPILNTNRFLAMIGFAPSGETGR